MQNSITQKDLMGCGIACVAFVCNISYKSAKKVLFRGLGDAEKTGYYLEDLVKAFARAKRDYKYKYIKKRLKYKYNTIVFIKRSEKYPEGHYLVKVKQGWMDPWINLVNNPDIKNARSGFRKRLPGKAIYVVYQK